MGSAANPSYNDRPNVGASPLNQYSISREKQGNEQERKHEQERKNKQELSLFPCLRKDGTGGSGSYQDEAAQDGAAKEKTGCDHSCEKSSDLVCNICFDKCGGGSNPINCDIKCDAIKCDIKCDINCDVNDDSFPCECEKKCNKLKETCDKLKYGLKPAQIIKECELDGCLCGSISREFNADGEKANLFGIEIGEKRVVYSASFLTPSFPEDDPPMTLREHIRAAQVEDEVYQRMADSIKSQSQSSQEAFDKLTELQRQMLGLPSKDPLLFTEPEEGEDLMEDQCYGGDSDAAEFKEDPESIQKAILEAIDERLDKISRKKFSEDDVARLKRILYDNWEAFGLSQGTGKMSLLSPIQAQLKPNAPSQLSAKARPVGAVQEKWLRKRISQLESAGIIRRTFNPKYSCPIHVVPKKSTDGTKKFRLVVDLRMINAIMERTALELPNLECLLLRVKHAKVYSTLDMLSGYDYLATSEESQQYFNMVLPWGATYCFIGAAQGFKNTPMEYQDRITREILEPAGLFEFEEPRNASGAIQWIDDTLLFSDTVEGMLQAIASLLTKAREKRVRFSIVKCSFLVCEAEFCGRIVSDGKWRFHEDYYKKILDIRRPEFQHQLAECAYLSTWLGQTITNLAEYRAIFGKSCPLGMNMVKLRRANLPIEWTDELETTWKSFVKEISEAMKKSLYIYDENLDLNILTDASKFFWSAILTQTPKEDRGKPMSEQKHRPLLMMSGRFNSSQINWHISQKELYPVLAVFDRVPFLIYGHPDKTFLYTDHRNLVFIIRPDWNPNRGYIDRLTRWSLRFQQADLVVVHVEGEQNVMADIISRWANDEYDRAGSVDAAKITQIPLNFLTYQDELETMFQAPGIQVECDAVTTRRQANEGRGEDSSEKDVGLKTSASKSVISVEKMLEALDADRLSFLSPYYEGNWKRLSISDLETLNGGKLPTSPDGKMQVSWDLGRHLIVHNHIAMIHPSLADELDSLTEYDIHLPDSFEGKLIDLIKGYRSRCIHCQRKPKLIRTPQDITNYASLPRQLLLMDYLYVNQCGYILVLQDACTRKVQLTYCAHANTMNVVDALLRWRADYGFLDSFIISSDRGSHFCNSLLDELGRALRFQHSYAISYAPWTNGSIETTMNPILDKLRTITSEFRLGESEWPQVLPMISHFINNKPTRRNHGKTSNELFLGFRQPKNTLLEMDVLAVIKKFRMVKPQDMDKVVQAATALSEEILQISERNAQFNRLEREKVNSKHNEKGKIRIIQFAIGDWVLVSRANTVRDRIKTKLKWIGPYQVVGYRSSNVYEVRSLDGEELTVHASRIWFYQNHLFKPSPAIMSQFQFDHGVLEIENILAIREEEDGSWSLRIKWLGFEGSANESSWEPMSDIILDVEPLVRKFLRSDKSAAARNALEALDRKQKSSKSQISVSAFSHGTPSLARGWMDIEKLILKRGIMEHGVGAYSMIHKHCYLPFKNSQQLYSQTQRLLGIQSIGEYTGIRLDPDVVFADNVRRHDGNDYFIQRDRVVTRDETLARRFFNLFKYELPPGKEVKIPFFRRNDSAELRREYLQQLIRCQEGLADARDIYPPVPDVSKEVAVMRGLILFDVQQAAESNRRTNILKEAKSYISRAFTLATLPSSVSIQNEEVNIRAVSDNLVSLSMGDTSEVFYLYPPDAIWCACDLTKLDFDQLALTLASADKSVCVLVMDPPWNIAGTSPTRGTSLNYPTLTKKEIFAIPIGKLMTTGYIFLWILNSSLQEALQYIQSQGFTFIDVIVWVKLTKRGEIHSSNGPHFNHGKELCLVGFRGYSEAQKLRNLGRDVIMSIRREQSRKPEELYVLIERGFRGALYCELFARPHNVRSGWLSLGLDLDDEITVDNAVIPSLRRQLGLTSMV